MILYDSVCTESVWYSDLFSAEMWTALLKMRKYIMAVYEFHHKHVIVLSLLERIAGSR